LVRPWKRRETICPALATLVCINGNGNVNGALSIFRDTELNSFWSQFLSKVAVPSFVHQYRWGQ
jgi:hypothetical protein